MAWLAAADRDATPWLLADFASLKAHSTRHGARPGPTLGSWCTGGSPACPAAESARKDPWPEEKSFVLRKKKVNFIHVKFCRMVKKRPKTKKKTYYL